MNSKWITALTVSVLLLTGRGLAAVNGNVTSTDAKPAEIKITFAKKLEQPMADLPLEVRHQGVESSGRVMDPTNHGAFSKLVAGHITALTVTWMDPKLLPSEAETTAFLRQLLVVPSGSTSTSIRWAQLLPSPTIAATVEHIDGKPGQWLVWYFPSSIYFAYQDGAEKWWFGSVATDASLKLGEPNTVVK